MMFPERSEIETIVLLKVARMCATPVATFLLPFALIIFGLSDSPGSRERAAVPVAGFASVSFFAAFAFVLLAGFASGAAGACACAVGAEADLASAGAAGVSGSGVGVGVVFSSAILLFRSIRLFRPSHLCCAARRRSYVVPCEYAHWLKSVGRGPVDRGYAGARGST